ncbi:MAG: carboxy-S-adenosyl-L-methionine synthase CmoA [Gammaproteobacteria bacterium]|nr:carboxy-S-adenosyl-L-methionine synthase CmoA [Gammaproteobacteria bacterium]
MSAQERDQVFAAPVERVADFKFGRDVANVFDDMLLRSVPFYAETQRMIGELAADFAVEGTNVFDLGCSTGTTMIELDRLLAPGVNFVGVDNSEDMLVKCRAKLQEHGFRHPYELVFQDLNQGCRVDNASLVLMVLTLQFIRPLQRERLLQDVFRGMNENGALILVEKVLGEESLFNRLFIEHYYDFKRRSGYSDLEITQKREALENVLVPYKLLENREMLLRTGFRHVDVFFKWYNFCAIIAVK